MEDQVLLEVLVFQHYPLQQQVFQLQLVLQGQVEMQLMVVKGLIQVFQLLHLQVVVKVQDIVQLFTEFQEDLEVVVQT